jgi:hypothetical protein
MLDLDQAATLRRLFARPQLRLLPVLMPELQCATRTSWVAKLAQGFARLGERTLVVDAARAQIAAALGLRARFDLAQAWQGDCELDAALVDAGPQLSIVPAARALQSAQESGVALVDQVAALGPVLGAHGGCDLVLLLLPAKAPLPAARLPCGDVLVPVLPSSSELTRTLHEIERMSAQAGAVHEAEPLAASGGIATTPAFRLLFLGMAPQAATTLVHRLSTRLRPSSPAPALRLAGAMQAARDLGGVVRAAGGWSLAQLELKG